MTCPNCRAENPPGSRFCAQCGAEIAVVCAACGVGNPLGSRYCTRCGTALAEAAKSVPQLRQFDYEKLEQRAVEQRDRVEMKRREVARAVFSQSDGD